MKKLSESKFKKYILDYNFLYKAWKDEKDMDDGTSRKTMQERGLDILAKHKGGFQFTNTFFPYTSCEIGPYYVQSGVVQNDGADFITAINDMAYLVKNTVGSDRLAQAVISGGETRDWIFSPPVAFGLSRPHIMLYKDGKSVGADIKGKEVIHVADLNNEGSSPRDLWVPAIKKAGGTINDIYFYVDRMEEGVHVMKELGLNSHAVVPLDEHAWEYLQETKVVTPEVYQNLMARGKSKEERGAWARGMLKTDAGLETLAKLAASEKTFSKAKGILDKGYPNMKDELIDRLKTRYGRGIARGL